MSTLVLAAHPDDEVLGCGGTIAKLAGNEAVHIVILGEGLMSRDEPNQIATSTLRATAEVVANKLGAESVACHGLPDNSLDTLPLLEVIKFIENIVLKLKPEKVYVQHGGDLNFDHAILFRAALTALRPMADQPVRAVRAFPVASSTEWSFQNFSPTFHATTYVDITTTIDLKIKAMALYESELREFPHPRSPEALMAAARHYGSHVGVAAAEPFQTIWEVY